MRLWAILSLMFLFVPLVSYSQELSGLQENEPLTVNGGVSVNTVFYHSKDTLSTREPFSFVLSGNLNIDIYNVVNCPITFTYSNYQANWSQPFNFNQFGMVPSYKWIKAYLGYNSMSFSDYTLSGHQFLGVGVELSPTEIPWKYAAMYGRLLKPVEEDTTDAYNVPAFARYGYATSVEYMGYGDIKFVVFRAWDNEHSLSKMPEMTTLSPKSNLAFSLSVSEPIGEQFSFEGEFSTSAINTDTRNKQLKDGEHIFRATGFLQKNTISTVYYCAYKGSLKYEGQGYGLGVSYERVNPGYETLGAYYFTNDFENITLDASARFLKETLNVSGRIGLQRNDLDKTNVSSTKKVVGSLNTQYAFSKKTTASATYSNFTGYTFIKSVFDDINAVDPYQNVDTMRYTQINQTLSTNISHLIGNVENKSLQQSINVNLTAQKQTMQENKLHKPGTRFYNGNLNYNVNLPERQLGFFSSVNVNYNKIPQSDDACTLGPTIGGNKGWLEGKLKANASVSYNTQLINRSGNDVFVFRLGGSYTLKEHHQFDLSFTEQNRNAKNQGRVNDVTLTIGYRYNFNKKYSEVFGK